MFQKWTVFVFAESWSRDQLMQKAYWYKRNSSLFDSLQTCCIYLATGHQSEIDFLKVVRMVSWSGVVGPGTNFRSLARSLARASRSALVQSRFALTVALHAQKVDLWASLQSEIPLLSKKIYCTQ